MNIPKWCLMLGFMEMDQITLLHIMHTKHAKHIHFQNIRKVSF